MAPVVPESTILRKAVEWVSKMREGGGSLVSLIEQASLRFNLSPKDADFLTHFFNEMKKSERDKNKD